jgi:hypothetical protein
MIELSDFTIAEQAHASTVRWIAKTYGEDDVFWEEIGDQGRAIAAEFVRAVRALAQTNAEVCLSNIRAWSLEHGETLVPSDPDTFGEGVRACKNQVAALLDYYRPIPTPAEHANIKRAVTKLHEERHRLLDQIRRLGHIAVLTAKLARVVRDIDVLELTEAGYVDALTDDDAIGKAP